MIKLSQKAKQSPHASIAINRYKICFACEHSSNDAFNCRVVDPKCGSGNCFGRWRTNINNDCPLGKWPKVEPTDKGIGG